jgi:hypothetical protein
VDEPPATDGPGAAWPSPRPEHGSRVQGGAGRLGWPPAPRDRFSGWCARVVASVPGWVLGILLVIGPVFWNVPFILDLVTDTDHEYAVVYTRYNDALVSGDLVAAWALGCPDDRGRVTLEEFTALYEDAVAPLGGLDDWRRLRGGPEWQGPDGTQHRNPPIHGQDGRQCVVLGGNPLGYEF